MAVGNFRISVTTAATAATLGAPVAVLWNPSTTRTIELLEVGLVAIAAPGAGSGFALVRVSARGTPTGPTAAVAAHAERDGQAPASGFAVDTVWSVAPTPVAGRLDAWVLAAAAASGLIRPYADGIAIAPGSGLALVARAAIIVPSCELALRVRD